MILVLQCLVLLYQGIVLFLSVPTYPLMTKQREKIDGNIIASRPWDNFLKSSTSNCMSCLVPGDYLSLDENLYPMRTQISFKQYNPNKPVKYGLLLKAIDAPCYPYTFIAAPRCGKSVEDLGEYYVFDTFEVVKKKVDRFESTVTLAGRNISFDSCILQFLLL